MNTLEIIVERLGQVSSILLSMFFLYRTLETKMDKKKQIFAGIIFVCVRVAYYIVNFGFRPYFSIAACLIYAHFVFRGKFRMHLTWSVIAIVLDGVVDSLVTGLYLVITNTSTMQTVLPGIDRMLFIIFTRILLFAIYYLITINIDKSINPKWKDCIFLLLISVGCWAMLEVLFQCCDLLPVNMAKSVMTVGSLALTVIAASFVAFYNRITANIKELTNSKLQLRTAEMVKEHIGEIKEINSRISAIYHDWHNQIIAIAGYMKARQYIELENYIDDLADEDMMISGVVKHPVLDVLISTRAKTARKKRIDFIANIELPEVLPVSDVDLCILVGNILDNAFESNEQVRGLRCIELNTRIINSYWMIACKNATKEKGDVKSFETIDSLKSTKRNAGVHGIGTRQIKAIAEKTGGYVMFKHDNNEFSILVQLKL